MWSFSPFVKIAKKSGNIKLTEATQPEIDEITLKNQKYFLEKHKDINSQKEYSTNCIQERIFVDKGNVKKLEKLN